MFASLPRGWFGRGRRHSAAQKAMLCMCQVEGMRAKHDAGKHGGWRVRFRLCGSGVGTCR